MIPELDLDNLDWNLYQAWQHLQKRNYGSAETLVAKCWRQVREFNLSLPEPECKLGDPWVPVEEALPPDPIVRLVKIQGRPETTLGAYKHDKGRWHLWDPEAMSWSYEDAVVTHWTDGHTLHGGEVPSDEHLPSTRDRGLVPAAKRLLYHFLNRRVNCGYECAWVYPYGWVPEAGCPEHD